MGPAINRVLNNTIASIVKPMVRSCTDIRDLASVKDTNCKVAYSIYRQGAEALGNDFVAAYTVLWACVCLLCFCTLGLATLYCLLWGLHQRGGSARMSRQPRVFSATRGSPSDDEHEGSDDELELQRPLTKSWR